MPPTPPTLPPGAGQSVGGGANGVEAEVDRLRARIRAARRVGRRLARATGAALLVGLVCLAGYYATSILPFAPLEGVPKISRDPADPDRIVLEYVPTGTGRVAFRRAGRDRDTELLDRVLGGSTGSAQRFQWRLPGVAAGETIQVTYRRGLSLCRRDLAVPEASAAGLTRGTLLGQVVNAVDNRPVPGAVVRAVGTNLETAADAAGWFRLESVPAGAVPLAVSAEGFTAEQFERRLAPGGEDAIRVVLSPGMEAGQMRIVLTWNEQPTDLDAHLQGPLPGGKRFHVNFHEKGNLASDQFVRLDVDDRDGEGPETITVLGVLPGAYRYFVHDYTHRDVPASTALADCGAEVRVYQGGQTYRFRPHHGRAGNIWNVCTIEVTPGGAVVEEVDTWEQTRSQSLGLYAKRTMANREEWIGQFGGTAESEGAVAEGLAWLARHQGPDGCWSSRYLGAGKPQSQCESDAPCTGAGGAYEMAHTGLALLAFQAGGHYDFNDNTYSRQVRRGLDWMVEHQRDDGGLIGTKTKPDDSNFHNYFMYEQGIATFALGEACALARAMGRPQNPRYISALRKAEGFIERMQYKDGGWRYWADVNRKGDTSVTGWQVLALKTARQAGVPVSGPCIEGVRRYFEARKMGRDGRTGYNNRKRSTEATTGVGMLARQFLLDEPHAALVGDAARFLAGRAESRWSGDRAPRRNDRNYYLWYNCALAMFQAGGEPWRRWNDVVRDMIVGLQCHHGCARGSWDPSSRWGNEGGRIYTTALAVLTLEVYYRYAAESQRGGGFSFGAVVSAIDPSQLPANPRAAELTGRDDEDAATARGDPTSEPKP